MSNGAAAALGTAALGILALLIARWTPTVEAVRGRAGTLGYLIATLVLLGLSVLIGAFAAGDLDGEQKTASMLVLIFGVTWGLMFALGSLLGDVFRALGEVMSERAYLTLVAVLSVGFVVLCLVVAALSLPLWLLLFCVWLTPVWMLVRSRF